MVLRPLSVKVRVVLLLVCGCTSCTVAFGQRFEPVLPLSADHVLICEAGAMLGGGGQAHVAVQPVVAAAPSHELQMLVEIVTRIDLNRDQQLDHHELQTLGYLTRQQLLQDVDKNFDRQLSKQELEQVLTPPPTQPTRHSTSEVRRPESPSPKVFRNVRRFGVGAPQASPATRDRSVSRPATFGATAGYFAPRSAPQQRNRRAALSFDVYLRSTGQFELTRRCP